MTAMASMGNLVVALPPSDIWLSDEQARLQTDWISFSCIFMYPKTANPNTPSCVGFAPFVDKTK